MGFNLINLDLICLQSFEVILIILMNLKRYRLKQEEAQNKQIDYKKSQRLEISDSFRHIDSANFNVKNQFKM